MSISTPADEQAVTQRAAMRDPEAFAVLYDSNVDRIYRYIFYKVGNPLEAEDLCEQVFLKAWEAIERYRWYGHPFSSWLYRLAHNLVIDHYRLRHRETVPLDDAFVSTDDADPEWTVQRRVTGEVLRDAIGRLTTEQRQVVYLKYIEGYGNSELATLLNKKVGAIRALQFRALRSLEQMLRDARALDQPWSARAEPARKSA